MKISKIILELEKLYDVIIEKIYISKDNQLVFETTNGEGILYDGVNSSLNEIKMINSKIFIMDIIGDDFDEFSFINIPFIGNRLISHGAIYFSTKEECWKLFELE